MEKIIQKIKVCALIERANKSLILKRNPKDKHYPNLWDIPSGGLEGGETLKQALTREIKEEIGLNVEEIKNLVLKEKINIKQAINLLED